jgi:hypothetical protein
VRVSSRNDDLTLVIVGWPFAEFEANKRDIDGAYVWTLELAPAACPTAALRPPASAGFSD